MNRNALKKDEE